MKRRFWKEIMVAVLLVSTILSFSPVVYGETTSVQQSIDKVKMEMKKAALTYVEPALKGGLVPISSLDAVLNSVKKNYQETRKIILASSLSEKEKQAKLKEIDALYEEKIVKGLIPYIDAYNYATKYLNPLLKEIKEAEAKNDFLAVEKAYHKLSVQLKSRTSILYRFTGKAPRDLLLEKYKKPADAKRDEMIVPVTIIMKLTNAHQLYQAGKVEEAKKAIEDIPVLMAKLSSTNPFHQALIKELERLQAIFFPAPVTPVVPTPPVTPPSTGGGGDTGGPSVPSSVKLAPGSLGKAGSKKITGLTATTKYVVTEGIKFYGVLANGTLSAVQTTKGVAETFAIALTGTEITGLTNGTSYKVEDVAPPTITIADDGSIIEGAEDGEVITVTLSKGTFVSTLDPSAFNLSNLPTGVSKGTVTRISDNEMTIALAGNRTLDYDTTITNLQVAVANRQIVGYTGLPVSANSGVKCIASNPEIAITDPTIEANRPDTVSGGKLLVFKAISTVDNVLDFSVWRVDGGKTTFKNVNVYIDLNDNGIVDSNEQVTADGIGGTINNGTALSISYSGAGTYDSKISITGLKLTTTQMTHDIIVFGDMDTLGTSGTSVILAVGKYYEEISSSKFGDAAEKLTVYGRVRH